jgi:hypothetical protein
MLAHLSILANLLTGLLGTAIALVIYLIYKDRSNFVAYHAWQSFIFQLIWWVGGGFLVGVAWTITGILSAFLIGLICIPFACILTLFPLLPQFMLWLAESKQIRVKISVTGW